MLAVCPARDWLLHGLSTLTDVSQWARLYSPLMLTRSRSSPTDGNHDVPIFDRRAGEFINETKPLPKVCPDLPRARDPYLGEHALQV